MRSSEPTASLRAVTKARLRSDMRCIAVLDDDPTGCQTVHGVEVLLNWRPDLVEDGLARADTALYILTNSRCMSSPQAMTVTQEATEVFLKASMKLNRPVTLVSRSDSTLRGHFPEEVDAMTYALSAAGLPQPDGLLLVPAFPEGGRITVGNTHWVVDDGHLIPVGDTPYAKDLAFGYSKSDLREWVEEKSKGRWQRDDVVSISLDTIRMEGPASVASGLMCTSKGQPIVVNAENYHDLDVVAAGLALAQDGGWTCLIRSAASFVKALAGISDMDTFINNPMLMPASTTSSSKGGLIVFGSHVPRSSQQLETLLALSGIEGIELLVPRVLAGDATEEVQRVTSLLDDVLARGLDACVYTTREVAVSNTAEENLGISRQVSHSLASVARGLSHRPAFVLGKGGITSHDLATRGLGIERATVIGQLLPGVPMWKLGSSSKWTGVTFTVFPGNVGDCNAVAMAVTRLRAMIGSYAG